MREILFRGKRTDNGEWVYGSFLQVEHDDNSLTAAIFHKKDAGGDAEVSSYTVGQYTGLTDKNGRKIFEGDIVRYGDGLYRVVFEQRNGTAYFGIAISEIETWYFANNVPANQMEVIGNIYDNPELMEGGVDNG